MQPEYLQIIQNGGIGLVPLLGWLYYQERAERLREREEHKTVAREMISAMVKTENTLATIGSLFMSGKGAP